MADRVKFAKNQKEDLSQFLMHELRRVLDSRGELEDNWEDWIELYRAPRPKVAKTFPYEGAADYIFPVAHMSVDPIKGKYMGSLHATNNLWTLKPLNERWIKHAKPLQDYLQWIDKNIIQMFDVNSRVINEMLKLGTGIYKVGWKFAQHKVTGYDQNLTRTKLIKTINQPVVDHVNLANFLIPPEALNIDPDAQGGAHWVAERHRMRPDVLRQMGESQEPFLPRFDPAAVEEVMKFVESEATDFDEKKAELDDVELMSQMSARKIRPVEIWEVKIRWDADGDGFEEDIEVMYHWKTKTILRAIYNPFAHGKRNYHAIRFLRGDGFYGIGLGERSFTWQTLISDILNFNIDKILLSNTPMFAIKEGANVLPNEPIFPGKLWPLTNPRDDIIPLFMTAPGSFDINSLLAFAQEASKNAVGVTDLSTGSIGQVPSRTPATTIQTLLQESNTRLDMSIKEARLGGLSVVGLQILQNIQQQVGNVVNNPSGQDYVSLAAMILGEPEGSFVAQTLQIPAESIEMGIGVELTATSGTNNKELQRQSFLALLQIMGQWGPQLVQLGQIAQGSQGTPLGQIAIELFSGARELLIRLMEQFDIRDPEQIVPSDLEALLGAQAQQQQQVPTGAFQGGGGASQGIPNGSGVQGF